MKIKIAFNVSKYRLITLSILATQLSNWMVELVETWRREEMKSRVKVSRGIA